MYRAESSASAVDAITNFIICAMVNIGIFSFEVGSFSGRNIKELAWLRDFDSLIKPVSECASSIILLAQNSIPQLGYVAT